MSATSSAIRGFENGKTSVAGRGEAQLIASTPDSRGCTRLRLKDTCYAPYLAQSHLRVAPQ